MGWFQQHPTLVPGDIIHPDYYSVTNGNQYVWDVQIVHSDPYNAWWVWANGAYIGYYPECRNDVTPPCPTSNPSIFSSTGLAPRASVISFYGEVFDSNASVGNPPVIPATTTDMGSGEAASLGFGRAAYMRDMRITPGGVQDNWQLFQSISGLTTPFVQDANCYSMSPNPPSTSGSTNRFYFGGDGDEAANCN